MQKFAWVHFFWQSLIYVHSVFMENENRQSLWPASQPASIYTSILATNSMMQRTQTVSHVHFSGKIAVYMMG